MESLDSGKPIGDARKDVDEVVFMFEYFGGWATKIDGDVQHLSPEAMFMVVEGADGGRRRHHPVELPDDDGDPEARPGARGRIPFILKPPEQTPLTCLELPKILEEAGLPAGVFHVLTGFGETAGAPLVGSPKVDKVAFTGSREVGKIIMRNGADTLKRVTLELGGKSPNGVFRNQGEICSAGTRVFV